MITRGVIFFGFLVAIPAGAFAINEQLVNTRAPTPAIKSADSKPADAGSVDANPAAAKPVAVKLAETKSAEPKPADIKPVEAKPVEAKPAAAAAPPVVVSPPVVVATPPAKTPAPVVTTPPVVTAPPAPVIAAPPARVVNLPAPEPAPVVVLPPAEAAPIPLKRPSDAEMKNRPVAAQALFASENLPSLGKAMAIGYYPRGCLSGAVALPVTGPTWQVMRVSRNRNWGHPSLVEYLEKFAPLASKATGWKGILVGDMAQPRGGPTPFGHRSHQTGLDVDIWFMPMPGHVLSKTEREKISAINLVADDWKHVSPKTWTPQHAEFIRVAAEQPEVERVLVNAAIKKEMCRMQGKKHPAWMDKLRPWYAHHDHIHVRLRCPAGSPDCRKQPPVPGDAGCDKSLDYWFSDKVLHPKIKKGGKPKPPMTMADLPPACKTVLAAPDKASSN